MSPLRRGEPRYVPVCMSAVGTELSVWLPAMRGEIGNFTGLDSPCEPPERPEIRLDTERLSPEELVMGRLA